MSGYYEFLSTLSSDEIEEAKMEFHNSLNELNDFPEIFPNRNEDNDIKVYDIELPLSESGKEHLFFN